MATVPTVRTFTDGVLETAATLNAGVRDVLSFLLSPPRVAVSGVAQSVASGSFVPLDCTTEDYDTDSMHSNVTNPARITIVTAGIYLVTGTATFAANTTGIRTVYFRLNGASSGIADSRTAASSGVSRASLSWETRFSAGDYIELGVNHTAGVALDVTPNGFSARRVAA